MRTRKGITRAHKETYTTAIVSVRLLATSTKICTMDSSTLPYGKALQYIMNAWAHRSGATRYKSIHMPSLLVRYIRFKGYYARTVKYRVK